MKKTKGNPAREKLRIMSLGEISKMSGQPISKSGLIRVTFDKREHPLLAERFKNAGFSNGNQKDIQDQNIETFKKLVGQMSKALEQSLSDEQDASRRFKEVEEVYLKAKTRLEGAKRAVAHARDSLQECQKSLNDAQEKRATLDKIVLVHQSATPAQLEKYEYYKFVVSYADSVALKQLGICDEVFGESQAANIKINGGSSIYHYNLDENMRSKVLYVQMVAWYMLHDIPYELAYADKTIHDLLVYNGII